jgi:hypothetical protein
MKHSAGMPLQQQQQLQQRLQWRRQQQVHLVVQVMTFGRLCQLQQQRPQRLQQQQLEVLASI